jgi:hypothetical protein
MGWWFTPANALFHETFTPCVKRGGNGGREGISSAGEYNGVV